MMLLVLGKTNVPVVTLRTDDSFDPAASRAGFIRALGGRSKIIATRFLIVLAAVAVQACAQIPARNSLSLESIRGVWWSDCNDASAEFVIAGSEYSGDFAGTYELQLTEDILVFKDGLIAGHSIDVTHHPLSFRVLRAGSGELVLRPMPGNPDVGDWRLTSCEHVG